MSEFDDDGGSAFPRAQQIDKYENIVVEDDPGMSLRDYLAAKALVALAVSDRDFNPVRDADVCYEVADAMLKARSAPSA